MQPSPAPQDIHRPHLRLPAGLLPVVGTALVCLSAALWATVGVAVGLMRPAVQLDSVSVALVRTALGAAGLLAVAGLLGRPLLTRALPLRALAVFGLAGAVFQICLFRAFAEVGVTVTVAVTVCLPPLIVTVLTALQARRLPGWPVVAALLTASLGVFLIVQPTDLTAGANSVGIGGVTLLVLASVAFSAVALAARHICQVCDPVVGTGLGLAVCATVLAVYGAFSGGLSLAPLAGLGRNDAAILLYLGLGATAGAYLAFSVGLTFCRSSASGLVASMIEPALAAVMATVLLGEHLPLPKLLGCLVVTSAMLLLWLPDLRTQRTRRLALRPPRRS
jgi:DME family drug/metabolite transporter